MNITSELGIVLSKNHFEKDENESPKINTKYLIWVFLR